MRLPRLPDLLTTANLGCGVASILLASQGQLTIACGLVFLAAVFDVLDGLAARALGGGSEFGKQLDSLADMVSFGVAPAFIALNAWGCLISQEDVAEILSSGPPRRYYSWPGVFPQPATSDQIFGILQYVAALFIPVASAWRLAKFNVDARQSHGFLGLPTPAHALFYASIALIAMDVGVLHGPLWELPAALTAGIMAPSLQHLVIFIGGGPIRWLAPILSLALSCLMLSELPLPSLKLKSAKWKGNEVIYLLLAASLLLIILYGVLAVPLILIIYLLSPLWGKLFPKNADSHGDTETRRNT